MTPEDLLRSLKIIADSQHSLSEQLFRVISALEGESIDSVPTTTKPETPTSKVPHPPAMGRIHGSKNPP